MFIIIIIKKMVDEKEIKKAVSVIKSPNSKYLKIIKKVRVCDKCPLRARHKQQVLKNGEVVDVLIPARCPYYEKGKTKCEFGTKQYVKLLKEFYKNGDDIKDKLKAIADMAIENSVMSAQQEIITQGVPGELTIQHQKMAVEALEKLNKLGEKSLNLNATLSIKALMEEITENEDKNIEG